MPATQTIEFNAISIAEIGSGAITAFIFNGTTLTATLASIAENGTLRGRYTGTVTDIAAGTYRVVVKFNGITISEAEYRVTLSLATGTYVAILDELAFGTSVFGHSYLEAIKRIEICSGGATLSGAGSGTEVMTSVDGTKTATFTVTPEGNVTLVVFS
jgi:hypothetical protein